jgi:D-alanine transaminase
VADLIVYLNGAFVPYDQAKVGIEDRSVQFADGVYEVVRYYGGVPFKMESHMRRLERSAAGIDLTIPPTSEIAVAMDELLRRNNLSDAAVYVQITRGETARLQGIPACIPPTVIAIARAAKSQRPATGIKAITQGDDRWARCNLKTTMLLPAMLARQRAAKLGAEDAIFVRDGFVTEATAANIFAVIDGVAVTPPLSNYLLPGCTREALLEMYAREGIAHREDLISQADLMRATEVFLTSTNGELRPIVEIDGRAVGTGQVGPIFDRTLALFDAATRQLATV